MFVCSFCASCEVLNALPLFLFFGFPPPIAWKHGYLWGITPAFNNNFSVISSTQVLEHHVYPEARVARWRDSSLTQLLRPSFEGSISVCVAGMISPRNVSASVRVCCDIVWDVCFPALSPEYHRGDMFV